MGEDGSKNHMCFESTYNKFCGPQAVIHVYLLISENALGSWLYLKSPPHRNPRSFAICGTCVLSHVFLLSFLQSKLPSQIKLV